MRCPRRMLLYRRRRRRRSVKGGSRPTTVHPGIGYACSWVCAGQIMFGLYESRPHLPEEQGGTFPALNKTDQAENGQGVPFTFCWIQPIMTSKAYRTSTCCKIISHLLPGQVTNRLESAWRGCPSVWILALHMVEQINYQFPQEGMWIHAAVRSCVAIMHGNTASVFAAESLFCTFNSKG